MVRGQVDFFSPVTCIDIIEMELSFFLFRFFLQGELERLNGASEEINKLELELDVSRVKPKVCQVYFFLFFTPFFLHPVPLFSVNIV